MKAFKEVGTRYDLSLVIVEDSAGFLGMVILSRGNGRGDEMSFLQITLMKRPCFTYIISLLSLYTHHSTKASGFRLLRRCRAGFPLSYQISLL